MNSRSSVIDKAQTSGMYRRSHEKEIFDWLQKKLVYLPPVPRKKFKSLKNSSKISTVTIKINKLKQQQEFLQVQIC